MSRSIGAILKDAPGYALLIYFTALFSIFLPLIIVVHVTPDVLWSESPQTMFILGWGIGILSYIGLMRLINRYAFDVLLIADVYLDTITYPMTGENDE